MSTVEMQIATRSREHPESALTNLHSFIGCELLEACLSSLNKKGASGVDQQSWHQYNEQREELIPQLHSAFKSGVYRAPPIRRVYIPKGNGKQRALGLPTVEDKLLQTAVTRVVTPVYEQLFYNFSYGFRPGKSQHQAIEHLFRAVSFEGKRYVIDADMEDYFGSINHGDLRKFLDRRLKDGVVRKQIDKWLKAGILEEGRITYPKSGTPQGGTISPLLSNIYLHYVLDEWFTEQIQPLLSGDSSIIRYADDFLLCFTNKEDALRVMEVLPKRIGKFGLRLHPEKTRMVELSEQGSGKSGSFDFLGFTHYMGKSRKGKPILKRKTSSKKISASLQGVNSWIKRHRHHRVGVLIDQLNQKLRGHYGYYGVTFNSRMLHAYYEQVKRKLYYWLNRRGGKRSWKWERYARFVKEWHPLLPPKIYHGYL